MNTSLTETPSLAPPSEAALSPSPHSGKHIQCAINRGDCQELPPDAVVDSCLGAVTPTFEPLKACLDDDSSLDDSEMSDCDGEPGDEFFFGEGEDIESMAMDCLNRPASAPRVIVSSPPSSMVPATTTSSGGPPSIIDASSADSSSAESAEQNSSQLARDKLAKELPAMGQNCQHSASYSSFHSARSSASKRSGKSRPRVSIASAVAVVPIPQRQEYSPQVRTRIWTSGQELYQNAARNTVEFAAEGWNWRSVTEDESMLVHTISGELIHPIHLENAIQLAQTNTQEGVEAAAMMAQLPLRPNTPSGISKDFASVAKRAAAVAAGIAMASASGAVPVSAPVASPKA